MDSPVIGSSVMDSPVVGSSVVGSPVVGSSVMDSPVVGSPPGMDSPVWSLTVVLPPPQPTRTVASPTAASAKRLRLLKFLVDETCFELVMAGGQMDTPIIDIEATDG